MPSLRLLERTLARNKGALSGAYWTDKGILRRSIFIVREYRCCSSALTYRCYLWCSSGGSALQERCTLIKSSFVRAIFVDISTKELEILVSIPKMRASFPPPLSLSLSLSLSWPCNRENKRRRRRLSRPDVRKFINPRAFRGLSGEKQRKRERKGNREARSRNARGARDGNSLSASIHFASYVLL
jgi:hypothetical protein